MRSPRSIVPRCACGLLAHHGGPHADDPARDDYLRARGRLRNMEIEQQAMRVRPTLGAEMTLPPVGWVGLTAKVIGWDASNRPDYSYRAHCAYEGCAWRSETSTDAIYVTRAARRHSDAHDAPDHPKLI